jgi:hypothetical protein
MRRTPGLSLVPLCALFVVGACGPPGENAPAESAPPAPPEALDRARGAADALTGDLVQRLLDELSSGGPAQAVRVCSEVAQEISAAHSVDGLAVRRVSLKARNPADEPDDYERAGLLELERRHLESAAPDEVVEVLEADGRRTLRYLRPIYVAEPCLACHGTSDVMDDEARRLIGERYPGDEATGYRAGDLRGAISVTVDLD